MRPQSKLRSEHPDWTQQQIADEVGVTQGYVNQVISKNLESKDLLIVPDHLTATDSKADFRKLPEELRPSSRTIQNAWRCFEKRWFKRKEQEPTSVTM